MKHCADNFFLSNCELFSSMTTTLKIRNCLLECLNSEAPQGLIQVVYLFGSFARNQQRAESDIDLAFLVAQEKYSIDAFECTAPLHMIAVTVGMA